MWAPVFEHTKSKVCVHILHNPTLSEENKRKFRQLADNYGHRVEFYEIEKLPKQLASLKSTSQFTEGTLYRLQIPELLFNSIKQIVYLDADIVVNVDIKELLNEMDNDKSVAAAKYPRLPKLSSKIKDILTLAGINDDGYFNAGIMVWNLDKIRLRDLLGEALKFTTSNPHIPFPDQDILNFVFKNDKKILSQKYNMLTYECRNNQHLQQVIYHFAGDVINPAAKEPFEKLFFDMLMKTPWGDNVSIQKYYVDEYEKLAASKKEWQTFCRYSRNKRLAVWGINSRFFGALSDMIAFDPDLDCAFDNDTTLYNEIRFGLKVHSPSILENEHSGKFYILVLSNLYYGEIKKQLESYGLRDKKDFIDARLLIGNMKFYA